VVVFSRNATTGILTFVEIQSDGAGDLDGLAGLRWDAKKDGVRAVDGLDAARWVTVRRR